MIPRPTATYRRVLRAAIAIVAVLVLPACARTVAETVDRSHDCGASASCASERNLAAMIADPRDLLRPASAIARDHHRAPRAEPSTAPAPGVRP